MLVSFPPPSNPLVTRSFSISIITLLVSSFSLGQASTGKTELARCGVLLTLAYVTNLTIWGLADVSPSVLKGHM